MKELIDPAFLPTLVTHIVLGALAVCFVFYAIGHQSQPNRRQQRRNATRRAQTRYCAAEFLIIGDTVQLRKALRNRALKQATLRQVEEREAAA